MSEIITSHESIPEKSSEISRALGEMQVRQYFQKMFELSTVELHESAFVVYRKQEKMQVSQMILPKITDHNFTEAGIRQHTKIDVVPYIINENYRCATNYDLCAYDDSNEVNIDKADSRLIYNIENNIDLDDFEKRDMINIIAIRAIERNKNIGVGRYRNDVVFVCHNHPQQPKPKTAAFNKLCPSVGDLQIHDMVAKYNPGLIDGIVASDNDGSELLLYRSQKGVETRPEEYGARQEPGRSSTASRLALLEDCGYEYAIVNLSKNGKIDKSTLGAIDKFALNS
jgi:hypothetical protein